MDSMLEGNNNLKDSVTNTLNIALKDNSISISYTKTNKLITALFMVTDVMDKEEPLRNKLRFLGTGIISDTYSNPNNLERKISETLSFLDISFAIGLISEMNLNILKKEFSELHRSVKEFTSQKNPMWLEEFMKEDESLNKEMNSIIHLNKPKTDVSHSIGHIQHTRIGVQKGSTLMKALSDKVTSFPLVKNHPSNPQIHLDSQNYDVLKKRRRDEIISIIKNKLSVFPESAGATITDIKNSAEGALVSCGEKTLQRELVSMVHDGVLKKTGEKRWSKYRLVSSN